MTEYDPNHGLPEIPVTDEDGKIVGETPVTDSEGNHVTDKTETLDEDDE